MLAATMVSLDRFCATDEGDAEMAADCQSRAGMPMPAAKRAVLTTCLS